MKFDVRASPLKRDLSRGRRFQRTIVFDSKATITSLHEDDVRGTRFDRVGNVAALCGFDADGSARKRLFSVQYFPADGGDRPNRRVRRRHVSSVSTTGRGTPASAIRPVSPTCSPNRRIRMRKRYSRTPCRGRPAKVRRHLLRAERVPCGHALLLTERLGESRVLVPL